MKTLEFYQVECPKCHGLLNSAVSLSGHLSCIFCGTDFHVTANISQKCEMPAQLVPFAASIDDFEQAAMKMLFDEDYAPPNVSEIISFKGVKGVYLPVYLYEGKYECSWSGKIKLAAADKSKKEYFRPHNGVAKGDFFILCMNVDGSETNKELCEFVRGFDFRGDGAKPFHADDLRGFYFLNRVHDAQKTWDQWGEEALHNLVRKNTLLQNGEVKDFKYGIESEMQREGRFMFYPVWMLKYQYDEETHHIFMDGAGRNGIKGTTLVDRELKTEAEKPFKILKYIAAVAIVIPLIALLAGWTTLAIAALAVTGLVFFGYRIYARWFRKKVIRKARRKFGLKYKV